MPQAVYSINTTVHSSTGFEPYQLVFGKSHPIRSDVVADTDASPAAYAERRLHQQHKNTRMAIASIFDSNLRAKAHSDEQHRPVFFEVDDLVLARVMGRVSKNQAKFQGPYRVTASCNDIYQVVNVKYEKDKLERHVADLRPFFVSIRHDASASADQSTNFIQ